MKGNERKSMENTINESLTYVLNVIEHLPSSTAKKIPNKFIEFLTKNSEKGYDLNIDYSKENWIESLPDDAIQIIAMIYRDYIVDSETRKQLIEEEKIIEKKMTDNSKKLFDRVNMKLDEKSYEQNKMVVYTKIPWYKKLFENVINLLKRR